MAEKLRPRQITLVLRRQEPDKPIIAEIKLEGQHRLRDIELIPFNLKYRSFRVYAQVSRITLTGDPADLWQMEQLLGTTLYEAFRSFVEPYCKLDLPTISHRDARSPELKIQLMVSGELALTMRDTLREHISAITGFDH